ncbi:MAG TPA: PAS domain-containing protein [Stellaceae bacterium]
MKNLTGIGSTLSPRPTHPKLSALLEFWHAKRGARRMPARADFDVLELREWLGHLHLIEVVDGGRDFHHRVYGTDLAIAFDMDLTGKGMSALPDGVREQVRQEYAHVCDSGEPLVIDDDPAVRSAVERVEKLILPLSSDGATVDRLLIGAFALKGSVARRGETAPRGGRVAALDEPLPAALPRERRRSRRVPVRWDAIVEIGEHRLSCTVLDYSRSGAKLQLDRHIAAEHGVRITLGRRGTRRGKAVWQRDGQAGIQFVDRSRRRSAVEAAG